MSRGLDGDAAEGLVLLKAGRAADAIPLLVTAAARQPGNAAFPTLLGHAHALLRALAPAADAYRQALALDRRVAATWYALGLVERDRGRYAEARDSQEQVLALDPQHVEAHFELAQLLLLDGDYGRGFAEYEWRLRRPAAPDRDLPQPVWQGEPLAGRRLLVYGEQGMGDVLQMVRFLPALARRGAHITLSCHAPLVPLLSTLPDVERTVAHFAEPDDCDLRIPLLSLPHRLGITLENLPPSVPYIPVPARPVAEAPARADGRKVGLVWAGSPLHRNDGNRSLSFDALLPLARLPDICLFSLQTGKAATDVARSGGVVTDLGSRFADFADTAAAVASLDLVITVDTAVAHLAGALGKPVWILLSLIPDWRWMTVCDGSPWYPTARLFRQPTPGGWPKVTENLVAALKTGHF